MEQAVTWADVKASTAVKKAAALATDDPWEMYEAAIMLMECVTVERNARSFRIRV